MKTLFVYCSGDDAINALCRESAFKKHNTESLQLSCLSDKPLFTKCIQAVKGYEYTSYKSYDVDFAEFDRIIIACDEFAGAVSPEIASFIKANDFRYKNVDCIVFGNGRSVRRASDALKVSVSLSGGTVRNCLNVSVRELKRSDEDLLFSVRHRLVV